MPKPSFGLSSSVRADIPCGVMRAAGDPDANTLQDWLVQGAPLGMDRRVETTGVFPPADKPDEEDHSPTRDASEQLIVWWWHYRSVLENPEDAHKEFEWCRAAQIAVDIDKDTLERLFPKGHVSKFGAQCQGVARKAQMAPGRGHEAFQGKRTSGSARAPDPASAARRRGRLGGVVFRGCLLGLHVRSRRFLRKCHVRLFRRILSRTGAPRRTQELFGRGSAFSFWIRPKHCAHVPYGVWFERCTTHMVPGRGCSWKGCASNAGGRPSVMPCSGPNQHIHRRPTPQLAWHAEAARQAASSRVTLLERSRVQSRLGQRDEVQGGQVDRFRVRTRFPSHTVTVRIPTKTADAFKQDAQELLNAPMLPLKKLRGLAGKGGWIMNLLPKSRWTIQRFWGAIAEEERRCSSLKTSMARKHARGEVRSYLIARRQVEVSLHWIVAFWGDQGLSFSRVFGETRPPAEFELAVDASPWGLGGILTAASSTEALDSR